MTRKTSADFAVGQTVICNDPDGFTSPTSDYLRGRTGVVEHVFPAVRPDPNWCARVNEVSVRWGKRNGRGKEKTMIMNPSYIDVVEATS